MGQTVWQPFLPGFLFILGTIFGSFINVIIYRLPREESIVFPASHCPECGNAIRWYHNIPLLGWLWLRGRCRDCGSAISIQYPLVELAAGLMILMVTSHFGLTWAGLALTLLGFSLLALTVIDLYHYLLPDAITKPGIVLGLLLAALPLAELEPLGEPFPTLRDSVIGAAVGYGGLRSFAWLFARLAGKDGMGLGDVKLFSMIGAWLGWQALPLTLFGAAIMGSVVGVTWIVAAGRDRHLPIPFGPYLALAGWIFAFYGPILYGWYFHTFLGYSG
ncbi:MAG: prepilin peptidase [Magnetococcales bacterium]|nr:prepilin peptidase [Magnetococcales bacterium]